MIRERNINNLRVIHQENILNTEEGLVTFICQSFYVCLFREVNKILN